MPRRFAEQKLVLASHNKGKAAEIAALLRPFAIEVISAASLGLPEPDETEDSFIGNAQLKALAATRASKLPALADDSGLCVDALDGAPGIYSARYAEGSDQTRWQKLLSELSGVPESQRQAAFVCALALAGPDGQLEVTEGRCPGAIGLGPKGDQGFGYDPVFLVAEDAQGRTMAELSDAEKNAISHRGRAFALMRPHLAELSP